jgi:hypothetical protein
MTPDASSRTTVSTPKAASSERRSLTITISIIAIAGE